MNHDVFISYSSKNKVAADAISHLLESGGIKCWIAPRDIPGGSEYGDLIDDAIKQASVVVVVFSRPASESQWVRGEMNIAFEEQKVIIPFRIDQTPLKGQNRVILNQKHWIDAYPDYEDKFGELVRAVKTALGRNADRKFPSNDQKINEKQKKSISYWNEFVIHPDKRDADRKSLIYFMLGLFAFILCVGAIIYGILAQNNEELEVVQKFFPPEWYEGKSADDIFYEANTLYNNADYVRSLELCLAAADSGHHMAEYYVAKIRTYGGSELEDSVAAVEWFQKAADGGVMEAQRTIGDYYSSGYRVIKDTKKAIKYYKLAAAQGDADSDRHLGVIYSQGLGVPKNKSLGMKWFIKAAETGDIKSIIFLGDLLYDYWKEHPDTDEGKQHLDKAKELFVKAAQEKLDGNFTTGPANKLTVRAIYYREGYANTPIDRTRARLMLGYAADAGNSTALYLLGEDAERQGNDKEARKYYRRAFEGKYFDMLTDERKSRLKKMFLGERQ